VAIDLDAIQALPMTDVTRILNAIEQGDGQAAEELLPSHTSNWQPGRTTPQRFVGFLRSQTPEWYLRRRDRH
jgi:hypothetical protein